MAPTGRDGVAEDRRHPQTADRLRGPRNLCPAGGVGPRPPAGGREARQEVPQCAPQEADGGMHPRLPEDHAPRRHGLADGQAAPAHGRSRDGHCGRAGVRGVCPPGLQRVHHPLQEAEHGGDLPRLAEEPHGLRAEDRLPPLQGHHGGLAPQVPELADRRARDGGQRRECLPA